MDVTARTECPVRTMDAQRFEKPVAQVFQKVLPGFSFDQAAQHIGVEVGVEKLFAGPFVEIGLKEL